MSSIVLLIILVLSINVWGWYIIHTVNKRGVQTVKAISIAKAALDSSDIKLNENLSRNIRENKQALSDLQGQQKSMVDKIGKVGKEISKLNQDLENLTKLCNKTNKQINELSDYYRETAASCKPA